MFGSRIFGGWCLCAALERIGGTTLDVHHISLVEQRDAERTTRSSLAVKAMVHGDLSRSPQASNFELTAVTLGTTNIHIMSLHERSVARL
jgi:hypothetical protein